MKRTLLSLAVAFEVGRALAADATGAVPAGALQRCAAITAPAERLSCYDTLAGRAAPAVAVAGTAAPAAPATVAAPTAVAAGAAAATPSAAPAAASPQTFGLYAAEHPKLAAGPSSVTARVVSLSYAGNGHQTVALEGGQVWQLDDADPVLAVDQTVSIRRASLGSFLMTTPSGRTHRAQRLH